MSFGLLLARGVQSLRFWGGGAQPFQPSQLAGLAFWYTADDSRNTIDGSSNIQTFFDRSGNARHGSSSGSTTRPASTVDPEGRAVARYDGSNDATSVGGTLPTLATATVFMAYRLRSHVNGQGLVGAGVATGVGKLEGFEIASAFTANNTSLAAKTAQADQINTPLRLDPKDKNYLVATIDLALGTVTGFYATSSDAGTSAAMGAITGIVIGARVNNAGPIGPYGNIDVYEVGLLNRVITAAEKTALGAYLVQRNGIAWSPGSFGTDLAWWHDDWSAFTLTGALVDQWSSRGDSGRHWTAAAGARPTKTTDTDGKVVVRFDGVDDVMAMAGTMPALSPLSVLLVYRVITRTDFEGVLSAAPAAGIDHQVHWTLQQASAAGGNMQWNINSLAADPGLLTRPDSALRQAALLIANAGAADYYDRAAGVADTYTAGLGTPNAIYLGARFNSGTFGFANIDVLASVGVTKAVSATERANLVEWAGRKGAA